ncbi:MAG: sigma-70 family RNA polymerase sigma factor [Planctomycetaceae bacterium]|nr:sigma-70 family RNA polymerase sigma factor [Planctomycetaceae bacterium]
MSQDPDTRDSLICQVRDPANHQAWEEFVTIYHPIVWRMARRSGLQEADADDLTQQVMAAVARAIPDWQPASAHTGFRHWLRRIARNAILNALTRRPKTLATGGTDFLQALHQIPCAEDSIDDQLEYEYRRQIYRLAAEMVRRSVQSQTWQAFVLTTTDGWSVQQAAGHLKLSVGSVHAARSRIMHRLQAEVEKLMEADR